MADTEQVAPATPAPSPPGDPGAPPLAPVELGRWVWRQLTSMRTALVLLFLLALAAIPGSLIPQTKVDPTAVARFKADHPGLVGWYDRLGLFSVYTSVWFSAIYLLLMVSVIGCVVPRTRVYLRALRARPPRPPRHLDRLPEHRTARPDAGDMGANDVIAAARGWLRQRRFRVEAHEAADGTRALAAERGRLREAGNLVFHASLLVVLVGVAVGSLFGYKGGALVVQGEGFSNTLTQYDRFQPGALFDADSLPPFSLTVTDFRATYQQSGPQRGAPRSFDATLRYTARPGARTQTYDLRVNHPLEIGGTQVYLVGQGYAPVVTVKDARGRTVLSGPVPFLPRDGNDTSSGVIKVPDATPEQLGFQGFFLPTAVFDPVRGPVSAFPQARNPALVLLAYHGNLGLDSGLPQNVYELDTSRLTVFHRSDGQPFRMLLQPGKTVRLPDGAGSIRFDGVRSWVQLQVSRSPASWLPLAGVLAAIAGLLASLFVRPRRIWVRVHRPSGSADGRTVVEAAGLDRVGGGDLGGELDDLMAALTRRPEIPPAPPADGSPARV